MSTKRRMFSQPAQPPDQTAADNEQPPLKKAKRVRIVYESKSKAECSATAPLALPSTWGRLFVGGTKRRFGYATPSHDMKGVKICPIISRGPAPYKELSPFFLNVSNEHRFHETKDKPEPHLGHVCVENLWQFQKVYPDVKQIRVTRGSVKKGTQTVPWAHPAEVHATKEEGVGDSDESSWKINSKWFAWHKKGLSNPHAVRRPNYTVNKGGRPLFSLWKGQRLGYVEARKAIYLPVYTAAVRKHAVYTGILEDLRAGQDIMLIDVDGPDRIEFPHGREMTPELLASVLEDTKRPFGHGFACAWALMQDVRK